MRNGNSAHIQERTSLCVALLLSLLLDTALSAPPAMTPPLGAIVRAPSTSDGFPIT